MSESVQPSAALTMMRDAAERGAAGRFYGSLDLPLVESVWRLLRAGENETHPWADDTSVPVIIRSEHGAIRYWPKMPVARPRLGRGQLGWGEHGSDPGGKTRAGRT